MLWSGKAGSALQARGTSEARGAEALFLLGILSGVTGILGELTRQLLCLHIITRGGPRSGRPVLGGTLGAS